MATTATTRQELSDQWVVTASPALDPGLTETLSEVDEWLTKSSHWLGFTLRFDDALDPSTVRDGLAKTLHHIPALGARILTTDGNKQSPFYRLSILDQEKTGKLTQGAILEYYKGYGGTDLPDDTHSRHVWKQAGLEAPTAGYSGEASINDPLLRVKLIVFAEQNVSYLCIGINHGVGDGHSITDMLQIWSHFCSRENLPDHLARPRSMGSRLFKAFKPATDKAELYQRMASEISTSHDPFSSWTMLSQVLPRAIWCMSFHQTIELRISFSKLTELKNKIMSSTFFRETGGEWVSSFEVLCASLLLAEWSTSPHGFPQQQHNIHVACNLRKRSERFPPDYFGNASLDFSQPIAKLPTGDAKYDAKTLVLIAQIIHSSIRKGLEKAEANACRAKDWFEAARHLGIKNTLDVWAPVVLDTLNGDGTFVNSWDKRWLECSMGGESCASAMVAWIGTLQNLVIQIPRHASSGDSTIYLSLPSSHANRFQTFCMEMEGKEGEVILPFHVVSK